MRTTLTRTRPARHSKGTHPVPTTPTATPAASSAKPWSTTWGSHHTRQNAPDRLLHTALIGADGDRGRIYFGGDNQVWVLNHDRTTTCPSIACPACDPTHPAHATSTGRSNR